MVSNSCGCDCREWDEFLVAVAVGIDFDSVVDVLA